MFPSLLHAISKNDNLEHGEYETLIWRCQLILLQNITHDMSTSFFLYGVVSKIPYIKYRIWDNLYLNTTPTFVHQTQIDSVFIDVHQHKQGSKNDPWKMKTQYLYIYLYINVQVFSSNRKKFKNWIMKAINTEQYIILISINFYITFIYKPVF